MYNSDFYEFSDPRLEVLQGSYTLIGIPHEVKRTLLARNKQLEIELKGVLVSIMLNNYSSLEC